MEWNKSYKPIDMRSTLLIEDGNAFRQERTNSEITLGPVSWKAVVLDPALFPDYNRGQTHFTYNRGGQVD